MTRILAIDLGKFKSVSCLLDTTTNATEFWTLSTDRHYLQRAVGMSDSITIKSCASREEAELLKSLLESSGIRAIVSADNYAGLPLLVSGGVQLQVLEEDVERARKIIEESEEHC